MAWNGDKLAWNAFVVIFVCVGILHWLWRSKNLYHTETMAVPSTSCKKFVNCSALNHWDVVDNSNLQEVGGCTHAKLRTFASDLHQTFRKCTAISMLYNSVYSNCDGSIKGRCYCNRFVARVGENWHIHLHSLRWYLTTVGRMIVTAIAALTPPMILYIW